MASLALVSVSDCFVAAIHLHHSQWSSLAGGWHRSRSGIEDTINSSITCSRVLVLSCRREETVDGQY